MKVNFKRMITALAAAAMCAVPMTSAMSAGAEYAELSKMQTLQGVQFSDVMEVNTGKAAQGVQLAASMETAKVNIKNKLEFQGDSDVIKALQNDKEYMNIMENTSFKTLAENEGEWCGNGIRYKFRKDRRHVIIIIIVIGPIIVWPRPHVDPPRDYMVRGLKNEQAALEMADKRAALKMAEVKPALVEKAASVKLSRA